MVDKKGVSFGVSSSKYNLSKHLAFQLSIKDLIETSPSNDNRGTHPSSSSALFGACHIDLHQALRSSVSLIEGLSPVPLSRRQTMNYGLEDLLIILELVRSIEPPKLLASKN